ncbi:MAG: hypothetical protein IKE75_00430 [Bacilli bacterium]|nr:hypothetical protein [Bacilli bacterium]
MDENFEMLECIYQNADMGAKSLTNLLNDIKEKDNKIKTLVSEEVKGYERFLKESKKLLKKNKIELKSKGTMSEIMSKIGIKKEVKNDNSDSAIAEMIIEGFTMGNLEIDKLITNYEKIVDTKVLKLAKDLHKFGEREITKLKEYI